MGVKSSTDVQNIFTSYQIISVGLNLIIDCAVGAPRNSKDFVNSLNLGDRQYLRKAISRPVDKK